MEVPSLEVGAMSQLQSIWLGACRLFRGLPGWGAGQRPVLLCYLWRRKMPSDVVGMVVA